VSTEKEVYVGAVIELNQKRVNLIPSTPINQIDERGLKLSLDKRLELGKFGDAIDSICKDLGVSNPIEKLKSIDVDILKNVVTKVETAKMAIEALQYEKPPVKLDKATNEKLPDDQQDPTKYVFVASVNWDDNEKLEGGADFFKLKGLILGISSGFTDSKTGENKVVQDAFLSALRGMEPAPALMPASEKPSENSELTKSAQKRTQTKESAS
jgi:hypothetical protein